MGHRIHTLYAIDLREPAAKTPPLLLADSFDSDFCAAQQQTIDAIHWENDWRSFSTVLRTPVWKLLPEGHSRLGAEMSRRAALARAACLSISSPMISEVDIAHPIVPPT